MIASMPMVYVIREKPENDHAGLFPNAKDPVVRVTKSHKG